MLAIKNHSHNNKDLGWDVTDARADVKEIVKRMTKDGLTSNSITLDQFDANNSNQET
jgi:hypothetical protein